MMGRTRDPFEQVLRTVQPRLERFVRKTARGRAWEADVVQDVLARLHEVLSHPGDAPIRNPEAYAIHYAHILMLQRFRSEKRHSSTSVSEALAQTGRTPEALGMGSDALGERETARRASDWLRGELSSRDRAVLGRVVAGEDRELVAQQEGVSGANLRQIVSRALGKLRRWMEREARIERTASTARRSGP